MQAGSSLIELLEPDGAGAVQDFVSKWGSGLFGAGFSVDDPRRSRTSSNKVAASVFDQSAGQLYLDSSRDLRDAHRHLATSRNARHVGRNNKNGRTKSPTSSAIGRRPAERYTRLFDLNPEKFSPIREQAVSATSARSRCSILRRASTESRYRTDHRREPRDGAASINAAGDSLYMFFVGDRRRRRTRAAPASARLPLRSASQRRSRPSLNSSSIHPHF